MNAEEKIYLPSQEQVDTADYLNRYIEREFPWPNRDTCAIYSVPKKFEKSGEKQATLAEQEVFTRLSNLGQTSGNLKGVWSIFFHSAIYAGHSFRNQRVGKLVIREHDFVVFVKHKNKYFLVLIEVKSTNDSPKHNLEKVSDAKVIKNNKRSAQHQLRDHLEVLEGVLGQNPGEKGVQSYIMWPFLAPLTKDPKQQPTKRWKEDKNLHVFEDTFEDQQKFNQWFLNNVLSGEQVEEKDFTRLLNRYIILSCGVFVDEINEGLMALLTQEQLALIGSNVCQQNRALVVHGAAGTGKTLLVLRKLEQLYRSGKLNEENRALYICYWPGIRYDMELKMESLGIRKFVDTARFYISTDDFLKNNHKTYRHIFMDEAEAICLSLDGCIIQHTLSTIYYKYHAHNCTSENCKHKILRPMEDISEKLSHHVVEDWGELWFMVDINQASLFLPKHSPQLLKTPSILLTKVMRSTGYIFAVFKQFYSVPMPLLPKKILDTVKIPDITIGHHVNGPPIYWVDSTSTIDKAVARVIIDLCSTKGFKAHDLCVIPFLVNEKLVPESINKYIDEEFVEKSFRPNAVKDVEHFLKYREINNFLIAWALRVKGLEFKVVVMAIDEDDFDKEDSEDRKKAYIVASRCTSMLIVVSTEKVKEGMDSEGRFQQYPFSRDLQMFNKVV